MTYQLMNDEEGNPKPCASCGYPAPLWTCKNGFFFCEICLNGPVTPRHVELRNFIAYCTNRILYPDLRPKE